MTINTSIKELDNLGERFRNWKQNNPHRSVPREFWNEALVHSDKYGRRAVAKSIGCAPSLIRLQAAKKTTYDRPRSCICGDTAKQPTFDVSQVQINIQNRNGVAVELSFQGGVALIFPLISSFFKEGAPCSR